MNEELKEAALNTKEKCSLKENWDRLWNDVGQRFLFKNRRDRLQRQITETEQLNCVQSSYVSQLSYEREVTNIRVKTGFHLTTISSLQTAQ